MSVLLGGVAEFQCSAEGFPSPTVYWFDSRNLPSEVMLQVCQQLQSSSKSPSHYIIYGLEWRLLFNAGVVLMFVLHTEFQCYIDIFTHRSGLGVSIFVSIFFTMNRI